ncbi:MAG: DUF4294 domain-containing protein [Owenweeksia sp.]
MKKILVLLTLVIGSTLAQAQPETGKKDSIVQYLSADGNRLLNAIIVDGDTIPMMILDEVLFMDKPSFDSEESRRRYYILRRKVLKVYPYAVIAGNKLDSLNLTLANIKRKKDRKRFIEDFQEYLEDKFEDRLRKLTRTEGQILSKLIYRETGITTYELIDEYRSGWNAFWWNVAANYYDISLKTPYEPKDVDEDRLIESILQRAFNQGLLEERKPITSL